MYCTGSSKEYIDEGDSCHLGTLTISAFDPLHWKIAITKWTQHDGIVVTTTDGSNILQISWAPQFSWNLTSFGNDTPFRGLEIPVRLSDALKQLLDRPLAVIS